MRTYFLIPRICISVAFVLATPLALSQAQPSDLKAAVDAAWQRSPQAKTLEARREEMTAGREAAQSWSWS
jgi:outer membrane protein, heavy metal efflux system